MFSWLNALRTRAIFTRTPSAWTIRQSRNSLGLRLYSEFVPPITKIEKIILDNIKATGPTSFATYMQLCLSHPTDGYYTNPSNPIFGSRGDFITSPEISQVFGELVGIWLLSQWINAGRPSAIRLVELGPGRGTLMDDIIRIISQSTASERPLKSVHLVETSGSLRSIQREKLHPSSREVGFNLHWHDSIDDVAASNEYTMLVAHEFFDALPIHVLQKTQRGWQEVLIASNNTEPSVSSTSNPEQPVSEPISTSNTYPRLRRVLSPTPTAASTLLGLSSPRFKDLPVGARIEISPTSFKTMRKVGALLSNGQNQGQGSASPAPGGCGLIVDYGGTKAFGDSFRAFKDHKIVDAFHRPGDCDLTANVDFAFLQEAAKDLAVTHGPIPQRAFLERMGLHVRVDALVRGAKTEERKTIIREAASRLVDRTAMGKEYQILGITSVGCNGEGRASVGVWPFVGVKEATENS